MHSKNKYVFIFITLLLLVTSITCAYAADDDANSANVGTTIKNNPKIIIDDIQDNDVDDEITISGHVHDDNGPIKAESIIIEGFTTLMVKKNQQEPYMPIPFGIKMVILVVSITQKPGVNLT